MKSQQARKSSKKPKHQEKTGISLFYNIVIPSVLMMKGGQWFGFTPEWTLVAALFFPISFGLSEFIIHKEYSLFAIVGFINVLLTGGIGILHLPKEWVAVKEAAVPLILGTAIFLTARSQRYALARIMLYNDKIIQLNKVDNAIKANQKEKPLRRLLRHCTYWISFSFLISAVLNYVLAQMIIKSETGTQAFTEELGKMQAWSFPVILVPCTIIMMIVLWQLYKGIRLYSGLEMEDIFQNMEPPSEKKQSSDKEASA